ncbi:MAG TPA: 6-phosphofructokinase, partial [Clostridia bacterium]|nr:6-phosphofructokinase [Clostridia bacterium]
VERVYKKFGRCTIAVSEGIEDEKGNPVISQLVEDEVDSHGNVQLSGNGLLGDMLAEAIKKRLNISRVRADTFGYLQRSFLGVRSDVDAKEAREVGEVGAKLAFKGLSGSVVMRRIPPYRVYYELVPIEKVARYSKSMPREFMNKEGNFVSEEFIQYARPLVGNDIPEIAVLRSPPIPKTFLVKHGEDVE